MLMNFWAKLKPLPERYARVFRFAARVAVNQKSVKKFLIRYVHLGACAHNNIKRNVMQTPEELKTIVKEKYGAIAQQGNSGCCTPAGDASSPAQPTSTGCCGTDQQASSACCGPESSSFLSPDYTQVEGYYAEADLGLGCGVPTKFANIAEGDVVLDLGSGAGNDVFAARSLVGESGRVIGVDMTEEMIARAQQNQTKLGYKNVEFRLGDIETLPVDTQEVDVVISNCVLNLVPDKHKAFQEIYRVLKPGGHFCVSDIALRGELPEKLKNLAEMYAGCVAGAMQRDEYLNTIRETGFVDLDMKKEQPFVVSDAILSQYLSPEEIDLYRQSSRGILSITVLAKKPMTA
jgi:arsenite methyltransferase